MWTLVGPVLLDFPYVYKLDGDKLFCNAPSINNPSGCCEGVIDYDAGYNFLYCTKCGVKYKAKELAQAIENNNVIVKSEGEFKMKVELSGGTKNINKDVVLDKKCTHTPSKPIKNKEEKVEKEIINKEEKKEVICPVEFDESLIKKTSDDNKSLVNKYIDSIKKIIESIEDDKEKKELEDLVTKGFETQIDKLVKPIKDELNDTIKKLEEITDDTENVENQE